jgi:hypothetical protein
MYRSGVRPIVLAFGVLLLVSASCGSSSPAASTAASTTAPITSAVTRPRPTVAPASTIAPPEAAPQPSPDQAAAALLGAWQHGDRATALRVASASAVATLFGRPAVSTEARGCQDPVGQMSDCAFGLSGSTLLTLHTIAVVAGGWVVDSVTFEG